ncbi:MAG: hypothetical protein DWQ47_17345 [Acidobacteria bacterium]|nr:MAG: hypothetical protein DWQ32_04745 [Acidobacteriota bacterium]REK02193.1 MAG: hypothetical protein DWQ38_07405 [Acidobacteriota bacterium]REK14004.1 MAG: hypothetical protein DWQ43_10435 [Acidobacteriota bacterium]REK41999.1 MAG: hypothetical protein DWQ47_17345 [Acidobacteriota bacterium]
MSVIVFNYLAATGTLNDTDTGAVSDKYPVQITPAGYAFSIWSLIYVGLLAFTIYQALPSRKDDEFFAKLRVPFILNSLLNCAWLVAWHYEFLALTVVLMFGILTTLLFISIRVSTADTVSQVLAVRAPFNLYFGWITVASIVNVSIFLTSAGLDPGSGFGTYAGTLLILVAAALGTFVRFRLNAFAYAMAIAWGVTAIAIEQSGNTPIVVAAAVAVVVLLFAALWGLVKDR